MDTVWWFIMFNKKGFIGAIGDDLPALIPIIIAILIFLAAFTNTIFTYDQKNFEIRKQIELSSISRTIKSDSLILDYEQFEENCNLARIRRSNYNYMVGIYESSKLDLEGTQEIINDFIYASQNNELDQFVKDIDDNPFFCNYRKVGGTDFSFNTQNYLIRFYPVAMQRKVDHSGTEFVLIEPVMMAMVIWN